MKNGEKKAETRFDFWVLLILQFFYKFVIIDVVNTWLAEDSPGHVRRTGEIGLLKVVSSQKYKGGVRISILCGKRALALFTEEHGERKPPGQ